VRHRTRHQTVQGVPALEEDALNSDDPGRFGSVFFVFNDLYIRVSGNGSIALSDLVTVAQSISPSLPSGVTEPSRSPPGTSASKTRVRLRFSPQAVAFFDQMHGVLVGKMVDRRCLDRDNCHHGLIESTADGGTSWRVRERTTQAVVDVSALVGTGLAWATVGSRIAETTDRGSTWRYLPHGDALAPSFASPTLGLAASREELSMKLLRTTDGGRSWKRLLSPCQGEIGFGESVSFPAVSSAWLLCTGQGGAGNEAKAVFESADQGRSWRPIAVEAFGKKQVGHGLSGYGYTIGISFLADGRGWMTAASGRCHRPSPTTTQPPRRRSGRRTRSAEHRGSRRARGRSRPSDPHSGRSGGGPYRRGASCRSRKRTGLSSNRDLRPGSVGHVSHQTERRHL
jgi:hypothetical protein